MKSWDRTKTLLGGILLALGALTGTEASAERLIARLLVDRISWSTGQLILGARIVVKGAVIISAHTLGGNRISITNSETESTLVLTPVPIRGTMPTKVLQLEALREWLELETIAIAPSACGGMKCAVEISGNIILDQFRGEYGNGGPEPSRKVQLATQDFVLVRSSVAQ